MSNGEISKISGRAMPLRGNDIDTDRIIPARYLRCITFDGLGEYAFEDDCRQDPAHPFNQECYRGAPLLFVGSNFGCGSSREHAPQALYKWGIRGIVGLSFGEIFFGNCTALGIPCLTVSAAELEDLYQTAEGDPGQEFELDVVGATVSFGSRKIAADIPAGVREALINGSWNATRVLLEAGELIEKTAARLPYLRLFR